MNGQDQGHSPVLSSTGDPHHHRAPSLGEMHQELEQEQEAQVVSVNPASAFRFIQNAEGTGDGGRGTRVFYRLPILFWVIHRHKQPLVNFGTPFHRTDCCK